MKKIQSILLTLLLIFSFTAPAFSAEVQVKEGTRVPVILPNTVSSDGLQSENTISAMISRDVLIDGVIAFKKNDPVLLNIESYKRSGVLGRAGSLKLNGATVQDASGKQHPASFGYQANGDGRRGIAITLFVLSFPLVLAFGLGLIIMPIAIAIRGRAASMQGGGVFDVLTTVPITVTLPDEATPAVSQ